MNKTYTDKQPPASTPWGSPQGGWRKYGDGVYMCQTASHGGFWISRERLADIPADLRATLWLGEGPWFEEDSDAYIVIGTWPELFPADWNTYAQREIERRRKEAA